jgi:hypothetical protein
MSSLAMATMAIVWMLNEFGIVSSCFYGNCPYWINLGSQTKGEKPLDSKKIISMHDNKWSKFHSYTSKTQHLKMVCFLFCFVFFSFSSSSSSFYVYSLHLFPSSISFVIDVVYKSSKNGTLAYATSLL